MSTTPRLVITKSFTYEGLGKEWSNSYSFLGGVPADYGEWADFVALVVAAEKLIHQNDVTIIKAEGWDDTHPYPVHTQVLSVVGTLSVSGASNAPRDCAAILRWSTDQRDSRNHPIYAYNYYHGCADYDSGSGHPAGWLYEPQKAAIETYAGAWLDGFGDYVRSTPKGANILDTYVDPWIRHRDFPR